ncbi:glycosyl hydrolase family 8 [Lactiplantibacillus songbeiensis]|uniref:Glucanase n=1 Tax=Lactiplantibacillus songbeiensis TaxID=2559920 RepID=A0ABW4BXV4_9LACO|nr:glycosyl hydrolase family 8 [Lactiplantibacillus songbeiensis]
MKHRRIWWLIGALVVLVIGSLGTAIWVTVQSQSVTATTPATTVTQHYRSWQTAYLADTGTQKFVKTNNGNGHLQTLSEAQGYGMLITVMAAQQGVRTQNTFKQLTHYYLAHRLSKALPLMAWRQTQTRGKMRSTAAEKTSATDGDLDIAYALILADQQWGSRGDVNYRQLAQRLIKAIKRTELNPTTKLPRVGNWATTGTDANLVRTSDLMTVDFRKFASYTRDGSWTRVAQNSQSLLQRLSQKQATGLMADFVTVTGAKATIGAVKPNQVATSHDAQYGYNACRVPWRVAVDYQTTHSQVSRQVLQKMLTFFAKQHQLTAIYRLNGQAVTSYANQAFTTPIAYAAQVMDQSALTKRYGDSLTHHISGNNYYPETIQMLMLLQSQSK